MVLVETGHVGLNVSDLERSRKFYQEVFGFQVLNQSLTAEQRFALIGDGDKLVLTLWEQSQGRFPKDQPGLHHLSFKMANLKEVEQVRQQLKTLDVKFIYEGIVPHNESGSSGAIFFEDPDGIRLEIFSPTGANPEVEMQPLPVAAAPTCGFF